MPGADDGPRPERVYETRDSGARVSYDSGMVRDVSTGKPRFDLTTPLDVPAEKQPLYRLAMLMARGADKYAERNWEQADSAEERNRAAESALRHCLQWYYITVLGPHLVPVEWLKEDHAAATAFNQMAADRLSHLLGYDDAIVEFLESLEDKA